MNLHSVCLVCGMLPLVLAGGRGGLQAAPPSPRLLPSSVRAYLEIADVGQLEARWRRTQLGCLIDDPKMRLFAEELARCTAAWREEFERSIGTTVAQLRSVASGSVTAAVAESADGDAELILLIDVSQTRRQADALLRRIRSGWRQRGVDGDVRQHDAGRIVAFDLAGEGKERRQTVFLLTRDGVLGIAASREAAEGILARAAGRRGGSLQDVRAFRDVLDRCANEAGRLRPDVRWFLDPVGCARLWAASASRQGEADPASFLQKHGFDAIRGVGGFVTLAVEEYDILYHTAVYAPEPFHGAMAMLRFPAGGDFCPPAWVGDELSTLSTIYLDFPQAFDHYGGLFDDLVAYGIQGTFDEIVQDIKKETGVDLRRDLIVFLRPRVTILSDYVQPARKRCAYLAAIAIDPDHDQQVADAIEALMKNDPDVSRVRVPGHQHDVWQIDREAAMVARGHLFLTTDVDLLYRVLRIGGSSLTNTADFKRVERDLSQLGAGAASFRIFARLGRESLATYRSLRRGRLADAETPYSRLLARATELCARRRGRKAAIDFTKLPEFETVSKYLGLAGLYGKNQPDGWLLVGFFLPRAN